MDIRKIRFANLNLDYDQDLIKNEMLKIADDNLLEITSPESVLKNQWRLPIFSSEQIENTTVYSLESQGTIYKKYPAWKGCSLTYVPGSRLSLIGSAKFRAETIDTEWLWREDIDISYTKSVVERLNFKKLNTVRLFMLESDGIGLVHQDDINFYENGGFSVTLNISTGGSPLVFLEGTEKHEIWPEKTHIFLDDCWHAIPQVKSTRIQLRVNGIPDEDFIASLIQTNSIIPVQQG